MRDHNRIEPFLSEIANMWHKVPDWRFGQLICNIPFGCGPFYIEDDEFLECMRKLFEANNEG